MKLKDYMLQDDDGMLTIQPSLVLYCAEDLKKVLEAFTFYNARFNIRNEDKIPESVISGLWDVLENVND